MTMLGPMIRTSWLAAVVVALVAGCAAVPPPAPSVPPPPPPPVAVEEPPPPPLRAVAPPARAASAQKPGTGAADRVFYGRAAAAGLYQVEAAKLATSRATAAPVKSHAQMVVVQQGQIHRELAAAMRTKGVPVPTSPAADKTTRLHRLAALKGTSFDHGYIQSVGVVDQSAAISLFERAGRESSDRELKAWVAKTLPVLRNQLSAAQGIVSTLPP